MNLNTIFFIYLAIWQLAQKSAEIIDAGASLQLATKLDLE